ncbi:helix-turn-helix domain-containing protein [Methylobacterium sp. NEAU K]|uniref:AlbA family DNA-binding domain-containing protein n=1 Tax=Methylobacterium sp. NEAU K TaxID=3064946 RepID=UPI0027374F81|nr:ATP-binding protein [Methylobacterium sp. NEAU K]MDP4005083.1 ATP-binding protein [Methylobacterium sp. NEAU K]
MRELYDRLIHEGEAGILRLIDARMQEGVQLDFKQKGDPRRGSFDGNDKKILAKAVSGFANSAGGLLVWGVNAEKGHDGVDCAQAPAAPIAQIELFLSEATTLVGQLLQPRHDGIHLHAVPSATAAGSGYLLMYIERSERRPHRSEASGQKQYFKRAGDSFFEMEHYDIEDAFKRVSAPKLSLEIEYQGSMMDGNGRPLVGIIVLFLRNIASITAKSPYLMIGRQSGVMGVHQAFSGKPIYEGTWTVYSGSVLSDIHPGQRRAVMRVELKFEWPNTANPKICTVESQAWYMGFDYRYGCENVEASEDHLQIDSRELGRLMSTLPAD